MSRNIFRQRKRREFGSGILAPKMKRGKDGVTRIVRDNYTKTWHTLVQEVLERDGRQCRHVNGEGKTCGATKGLQVHHIKRLSDGGRTEKMNLITLCEQHHESRHTHLIRRG